MTDVDISPIEGGFIAETSILLAYEQQLGHIEMDMSARGKTPAMAVFNLEKAIDEAQREFREQRLRRIQVTSIVRATEGSSDSEDVESVRDGGSQASDTTARLLRSEPDAEAVGQASKDEGND